MDQVLTIFRRHTNECMERHGGKDPGRKYRRCLCPIHAEGHLGGVMYRKALDTTSWTRAQDVVREKEARGTWDDPSAKKQVPIAEAVTTFVRSLTASSNGKANSTTRKIRSILLGVNPEWAIQTQRQVDEGLLDFSRNTGLTTVDQLTVPVLSEYAAGWTCGPKHRSKRVQLLRRFFRYSIAAGWLATNPALSLEHPNGRATKVQPKQPFDAQHLPQEGPEWKAIVEQVMEAIQPNPAGYYFWSGQSAITTATDNWRRRFEQVFKQAGIEGGHPHRFRDTFAVDLLLRGVPIDQVSALLGHSSVKITEQYYLPFVAARRRQIADSLRRAWANGTTAE